ncbi:MAG: hypothetical protein DRP89_06115 [Candidatus Neomarinimicrobiota bacterium]|nr:MAG: hypothetical protein DRP89_06115 [Candidatus Neomarinimicrobiota bacterium]
MRSPDILVAVQPIVQAFENLSIDYYIGGSIASSLYGTPRATIDVDMVADIKNSQILPLKVLLQKNYYIDEQMIADAVRSKSSFNLIHLETMIKIDIFIYSDDPYQKSAISRRVKDTLEESDQTVEFYFSSPEDVIINKLQWYEMGERVSERQWLDVVGIIKVQGNSLDKKYLLNWSKRLNLMELLDKAFNEAGVSLSEISDK